MQQLNVTQLKQLLHSEQPTPLLLDVREPWEFDICRINGSKLIPLREIHYAIEQLDRQQHTVVICHHGIRSQQACFYLTQMGFSNIFNLRGGVNAWALEVDPSMATY